MCSKLTRGLKASSQTRRFPVAQKEPRSIMMINNHGDTNGNNNEN
jgi:hypothetical protein